MTEDILGKAVVIEKYESPKLGFIYGCKLTQGTISKNDDIYFLHADTIKLSVRQLTKFREVVIKVSEGYFGLTLTSAIQLNVGDTIICVKKKSIKVKASGVSTFEIDLRDLVNKEVKSRLKNVSQVQLAESTGMLQSDFSELIRGKNVSFIKIMRMAKELGIQIDYTLSIN